MVGSRVVEAGVSTSARSFAFKQEGGNDDVEPKEAGGVSLRVQGPLLHREAAAQADRGSGEVGSGIAATPGRPTTNWRRDLAQFVADKGGTILFLQFIAFGERMIRDNPNWGPPAKGNRLYEAWSKMNSEGRIEYAP